MITIIFGEEASCLVTGQKDRLETVQTIFVDEAGTILIDQVKKLLR